MFEIAGWLARSERACMTRLKRVFISHKLGLCHDCLLRSHTHVPAHVCGSRPTALDAQSRNSAGGRGATMARSLVNCGASWAYASIGEGWRPAQCHELELLSIWSHEKNT